MPVFPFRPSVAREYPAMFLLGISIALLLSGCAGIKSGTVSVPPLNGYSQHPHVEDVDILAVSDGMEQFLQTYVLRYAGPQTRADALIRALSQEAGFDFRYDADLSLTAAEAFARREGNCIAFSNMYIALARRAGLQAWYQEVAAQPDWSNHEEVMLVVKHINVVIEGPRRNYVIDILGKSARAYDQRRRLPDAEAKGLYFNNHGALALLNNDLPVAHANFARAISVAPGLADGWSNLGVAYVRAGQDTDAEWAYRNALSVDWAERSALGNLHELFVRQGRLAEAAEVSARVERHRRKNPYYLLYLAEEAIQQTRFEESLRLLNRAIGRKADDHFLHLAMARAQYLSGHESAAYESFERARKLAPVEAESQYSKPLREVLANFVLPGME